MTAIANCGRCRGRGWIRRRMVRNEEVRTPCPSCNPAAYAQEQLERTGREVVSQTIITESHAGPYIDTIVLILTTFGLLILLLSGFLVVNAISALITQQVRQIGVMKLVGARRWQIMAMYIVTVSVYGLLAIVIGLHYLPSPRGC